MCAFRQRRMSVPDDWQYTVRTIQMENKTWPIHKKNYTFNKQLGHGSFGEVYAAYRHPDNKLFAVKVVSLATRDIEDSRRNYESVLNEFRMTRKFAQITNHIVYMYDFGFDPKLAVAYLVMELGQQDLEKYLSVRSSLSSTDRKAIWKQLVSIAVALHTRQIVHRDIKPKNLIVFSGNRVKLCDLGIAKQAFERVKPSGTPRYSAPEAISRNPMGPLTTRADVWSWGAVLYRMTYMAHPPGNEPYHRPPPNQHVSRDPDLVDVLQHTFVKNPSDRASVLWLVNHRYTKTV